MAEIVILGNQASHHHSEALEHHFGVRVVIEPDWRPSTIAVHNPDLVIAFEESHPERGLCMGEMVKHNVATLLMVDGIPEWRNTWSRSDSVSKRPINQPILSHKVACLGNIDARVFESWGNVGKCEVVGSPRFDRIIDLGKPLRVDPIQGRPMRLLIMTAKTPGFTPEEVEITFRSLRDLSLHLRQRSDVQVIWRITEGLHKRLGVRNSYSDPTGMELYDILDLVDAVITTPSTAMLEAMLFGHPLALLDYHNCPHYVSAAWRITCQDQIAPVLEDLKDAPLTRMLYQDYCLHDALACRTPALPRAVELIEKMIQIKRQRDANGSGDLVFPHRILDQPGEFVAWPSERFDLRSLYPNHPVFGRKDLVVMQSELEAALGTVDQLKKDNQVLTRRLHSIPGYLLVKRLAQTFEKRLE